MSKQKEIIEEEHKIIGTEHNLLIVDDIETQEFNLTKSLRDWRKERNINSITRATYVKQIIEELFELYLTDKKAIDTNTLALYNTWFLHLERNEIDNDTFVDTLQDIQVFSTNATELLGFDNLKSNEEVFKEINSREQCPKQKLEWEKRGNNGEKWQKNKEQLEETLYKANFENCLLEDY